MIGSVQQGYKDPDTGCHIVVEDDFGSVIMIKYYDENYKKLHQIGLPREAATLLLKSGQGFLDYRDKCLGS